MRRGAIIYGHSYSDVMTLAASPALQSEDEGHVINLASCSVAKCPEKTDSLHYALLLTTCKASVVCVCVCVWRVLCCVVCVFHGARAAVALFGCVRP